MRHGDGYKLRVGVLNPGYVETAISDDIFNKPLSTIYTETCGDDVKGLCSQRESCGKLRSFPWYPAEPHQRRERGVHYILCVVYH